MNGYGEKNAASLLLSFPSPGFDDSPDMMVTVWEFRHPAYA